MFVPIKKNFSQRNTRIIFYFCGKSFLNYIEWTSMQEWYEIDAIDQMDSPALVVYPKRILRNIEWAVQMAGGPDLLRPHVKTNKMAEVCRMMQDAGITRFKCATIAEAEMLAFRRTA